MAGNNDLVTKGILYAKDLVSEGERKSALEHLSVLIEQAPTAESLRDIERWNLGEEDREEVSCPPISAQNIETKGLTWSGWRMMRCKLSFV